MAQFSEHTDDAILWNYFRSGDEDAFTELSHRYYRTLIQYGQRFTLNMQVVEDTLQDLLVHLWLHRETINDTPSVKFYLIKSFRHRMLKTIKPLLEEVELTDRFEDMNTEFSCEDFLIQREHEYALKKQVKNAVDQLPVRQQEVIYLRFFQNLQPEEIGRLLSINSQSVSNIIQRALHNLRNMWISTPPFSILICSFFQILY
ncbi:sigma-70 family RNA polymerase sigma factor [Dyadobacter chenwenxiniae]|uniref:Sigma-70 family RNA polymerase sigma factor n=1 Tax=Dyadobacter chenwenxiniae TaxID=2906456 RepID=A0A9X1PLG6_9BACT|nr:sigma-70 family RNA polymerase sigma factor [Dyadobacter chenwenxiniae]MCF0063562.1 sigma-70 family RNA polymerase sigma factor [Dyadobacter chenwenxiniae]UON83239.1 sigma-70 family RNA polymerase sigma factor [Dyadobacter chenwenxiniae]